MAREKREEIRGNEGFLKCFLKIKNLKDKSQKTEINQCTFQPKTNRKFEIKSISSKDIKKKEKIKEIAHEIISFHSANLIINEKTIIKQEKNQKKDEKIKELYANFQKIRENKNFSNEKKKESNKKDEKNKRSQGNKVRSAEKEINKEIHDILEIFKNASKALNSEKKKIEKPKNNIHSEQLKV